VGTDFGEGSLPALRMAQTIIRAVKADATLLHVLDLPSSVVPDFLSPLGSTWMPSTKESMDRLRELGTTTLAGLAKQYGFARFEEAEGNPADSLLSRAASLGAEMILLGSRGRTGLRRLVLGSVAETVVRSARCSVLVAR
jgi:nucleotide-binding universal stress UspA family protein